MEDKTPCYVEGFNRGIWYKRYDSVKEAANNHAVGDVHFWTETGQKFKDEYIRALQAGIDWDGGDSQK